MALVNSIRRSIGTVVDGTLHARFNSNSSLPPSSFLGSWKAPRNPRVAQERLAKLRKDYEKQVKELRKQYQNEMEFKRLEEQAKREADRESIRVAREERKALKRQQSQERALQRRQQEEEFKEMLCKERAEKSERWKQKVMLLEEKRAKEKELIRHQSSLWIDEKDLDRRILEAIVDTTPL